MTSADAKCGAASAAKRIISTAPMLKFGATTTPTFGAAPSQPRTWSSRWSSNPVVPTTAWMPWLTHHSMLPITASGWVKSTATCAPAAASALMSSSTSTSATSVRSSAASTARQTSDPIRPREPMTPTGIALSGNGRSDGVASLVVERPDSSESARTGEHVGGDRADVVERHSFDVLEHFVDPEQLSLHELALAEPAHARAGVLQSEHERATQL